MANKKVTLDVAVKADDKEVDGLEKKLKSAKQRASELKQQKIQMKIDADTSKLNETNAKINSLKSELNGLVSKAYTLNVPVDTNKVNELQAQIEELDGKAIALEASVEKGKVDALQEQIENMDGKTVTVNTATDSSGLGDIQNKLIGVAGTLGMVDQATQMWEASTARQSQQMYLASNIGQESAQKMQKEIQNIVSQVPGDDTFMNQLMTTALAQNTKMTTEELKNMANVAADYMAGSKMMGKMNLESQQDIYKYLLDGNTAELERGSILSSQVDKLKDQATIQDRIKAINEALKTMGYAGISGYDTAANNLEEFQGRLEKARADWGDVFLPLEQGALKFALALDDTYGGALAMAITGTEALVPTVISGVTAFGEFHRGIEAIKDTKIGDWASTAKDKIKGIGDSIKNVNASSKFDGLKNSLVDLGTKAKTTALSLGNTLKKALLDVVDASKKAVTWLAKTAVEVLKSGVNAGKAAVGWIADKAAKLADIVVTKAVAVAQAFLNAIMGMNPIYLVVMAIVALIAILWYLYNTNESVRNAIDGFGQALFGIADTIYGALMGAFDWLQGAWQNTVDFFTNGANAINEGVIGAFNWLRDSIVGTFTGIYDTVMGTWQGIVDWLTNGVNTINDTLNPAIQWLTESLQWLSDLITGSVIGAVQWLTDQFTWLSDIWNQVTNAFNTYAPLVAQVLFVMATGGVGAIVLLIANFMGMPNQIGGALQSVITRVAGFVGDLVGRMGNGARQAVSNFASGISNLGQALRDELQGMLNDAANFVGQIGQIMWNAAVNAWNNFLSGLDRHSPGKMMREWNAEIGGIIEIGENAEKPLGESMANLAKSAIQNFNPVLKYGEFDTPDIDISANNKASNIEGLLNQIIEALNNIGTSEGNLTFNLYGDMDKEQRMQEFLEYVRKYLEWKNDTAGRTV